MASKQTDGTKRQVRTTCLSYGVGIFSPLHLPIFSQTETLAPPMPPHYEGNTQTHTHTSLPRMTNNTHKEQPSSFSNPQNSVSYQRRRVVFWGKRAHAVFSFCYDTHFKGDLGLSLSLSLHVCVWETVKSASPKPTSCLSLWMKTIMVPARRTQTK